MANPDGAYIRYELLTTDPDAAGDFYGKVVGRTVGDAGMGGGTVTFGPMEVPGGDRVVNGVDPQGASFGIVGSKN